jgi:hypothetical protein
MKKSLALTLLSVLAITASAGAAQAADNKLKDGAKKVGSAIVWPFKKMGEGIKAVGKKISGK